MAKAEGSVPSAKGASPTDQFFARLAAEPDQPLLKRRHGTVRFDIAEGPVVEHWTVTIDDGRVKVANRKGRSDTVVYAERADFDGVVSGTMNGMAAFLRGQMTAEGDLGLVMLFQRLFPGPVAPPRRTSAGASKAERERAGVSS